MWQAEEAGHVEALRVSCWKKTRKALWQGCEQVAGRRAVQLEGPAPREALPAIARPSVLSRNQVGALSDAVCGLKQDLKCSLGLQH